VVRFAGVLVTIGPRDSAISVIATVAGVMAAVIGLSAFWPGRFPALEPTISGRICRPRSGSRAW
jgi:hypothetical protein